MKWAQIPVIFFVCSTWNEKYARFSHFTYITFMIIIIIIKIYFIEWLFVSIFPFSTLLHSLSSIHKRKILKIPSFLMSLLMLLLWMCLYVHSWYVCCINSYCVNSQFFLSHLFSHLFSYFHFLSICWIILWKLYVEKKKQLENSTIYVNWNDLNAGWGGGRCGTV